MYLLYADGALCNHIVVLFLFVKVYKELKGGTRTTTDY